MRMRNSFVSLLMAGSVLAGCTMIPDYQRPELPVAAEWPVGVKPAVDESGQKLPPAASIAWQEFFRSPQMQQVIATALDHNRDLRVAVLNVEAARASYNVQRAGLFPNITGDVAGNKSRLSQNVPVNNGGGGGSFINEYYTAEVSASYGLDFFGRVRSMSQSAQERFLATEEASKAVRVSLIAETANAYLQLQADREILKLTEDTLKAQEKSFDLISERFDKGVGSKLDMSQAQIPVETARVNHALYTRLVEQDKNALMVLMGEQAAKPLLTEQSLDSFDLMEDLPVGLPSEVLLLRPDIREAEHQLLSANADIGAARAAFFPSITLTGSYGQSSAELSDLFSGGASEIWSFMPRVSVPIFQGGRNFANLDLSKVNKDIAIAQYEKAIQSAFREVSDELAARATLDAQLEAQRNLTQASQDAYDVSNARYRQGIDSFLTVLDAQRSLFSAQQGAIEIEKQRLANIVNLYKVLGGGQASANEDDAPVAVAAPAASQPVAAPAEQPATAAAEAPAEAAPAERDSAGDKKLYVKEVTVVTDTPQGTVNDMTVITTQKNAEGEIENVGVRTTSVTPEQGQ